MIHIVILWENEIQHINNMLVLNSKRNKISTPILELEINQIRSTIKSEK